MVQYIDKSALVAEINRRLDELYELLPNASKVERGTISISEACNTGKYTALESFKDYIDTLEVKEVGIAIPDIDNLLEEDDINPNSKEAKIFKESYYMALERLKAQKGEDV